MEKELGRYKHKVQKQNEEIKRLKGVVEEYEKGLRELNRAVDGILATVVRKHGAQVGSDAWELMIPRVDLAERYIVHSANVESTDEICIRVTRPLTQ